MHQYNLQWNRHTAQPCDHGCTRCIICIISLLPISAPAPAFAQRLDNLDDDDDAPASAENATATVAAPQTSAVFADDDAEDPLSNAPAPAAAPPALPKPRVSAAPSGLYQTFSKISIKCSNACAPTFMCRLWSMSRCANWLSPSFHSTFFCYQPICQC